MRPRIDVVYNLVAILADSVGLKMSLEISFMATLVVGFDIRFFAMACLTIRCVNVLVGLTLAPLAKLSPERFKSWIVRAILADSSNELADFQ